MKKLLTKNVIIKVIIIVLVIALILAIYNKSYNIVLMRIYPLKYSEYVEKYSVENKLDKELIYALIKQESNFNKECVSSMYAIGLMQILDSTAKQMASKVNINYETNMLYDPEINIKLGTRYLANLYAKYNNIEIALAAYNAGTGNVDNWIENGTIKENGSDIENIPFRETNNYVRKVMNNYQIYKQIYN